MNAELDTTVTVGEQLSRCPALVRTWLGSGVRVEGSGVRGQGRGGQGLGLGVRV